jgi:hypothetical protein
LRTSKLKNISVPVPVLVCTKPILKDAMFVERLENETLGAEPDLVIDIAEPDRHAIYGGPATIR